MYLPVFVNRHIPVGVCAFGFVVWGESGLFFLSGEDDHEQAPVHTVVFCNLYFPSGRLKRGQKPSKCYFPGKREGFVKASVLRDTL